MDRDPAMPPPSEVHPDFDGHAERPWASLTPDEKLDWLWEMMALLRAGRERADAAEGSAGDPEG